MKNFKKFLVAFLGLGLLFGAASCGKKDSDKYGQAKKVDGYETTYATREYLDGITTKQAATGAWDIAHDVYAGLAGKDYQHAFNEDGTLKAYDANNYYTMQDFTPSMSTLNWNIHTWETNDDAGLVDYITTGFYAFVLNEDKTGYSIVPEMAAEMPVDVTDLYADLADEEGVPTAESLGVGWDYVSVSKDAFDAFDSVYKMCFLGKEGFELYQGATLEQFAEAYECESVEEFVTDYLGFDSLADLDANYAKYLIRQNDTNKAFRIYLNDLACWDDGTPITAQDYVWSMKMLLDPSMANRRADSFYAGSFVLYNAKNYFYAGKSLYKAVECPAGWDSAADFDGITTNADFGDKLIFCVGGYTKDGVSGQSFIDEWAPANGWPLDELLAALGVDGAAVKALTGKTWNEIAANAADKALVDSLIDAWKTEPNEEFNFFVEFAAYPELAFDQVGIKAGSDTKGEYIDLVVSTPIDHPEYYVPYNLSSNWLVKKSLYEAKNTYNAETKTWTIKYCTNADVKAVENSASFGPYKLTYFEDGKGYTLSRNEKWYGYHDGKHVGQYQMDALNVSVIATHAAELESFLKGNIDSVGLQSEDMAKYGSSSALRYQPQDYTTKLSFNTNYESLVKRGTNAQILVNEKLRKAWALAIDSATFATTYTSAGTAGYGMINELYVYDPVNGYSYRNTDAAKKALLDLEGIEYGPGKQYATLDEAYAALSLFDLDQARALMKEAYAECVAAGLWDENCKKATFQISVYQSDDIYVQMFNYLNKALKDACVGSGFEGKVSLTMKVDDDYYNTMYSGNTDIIFTTWGGAASQPFTILYECYCDKADGSGQQMEYGFDTSKVMVKIKIDGVEYTASLQKWALWADDSDANCKITYVNPDNAEDTHELNAFTYYDYDTRCEIYACLENAYLSCGATTSLYYRNAALLLSKKGDYAVKKYMDTIGFGGVQFYTFNYTDAEWAAYCAQGTIDYVN